MFVSLLRIFFSVRVVDSKLHRYHLPYYVFYQEHVFLSVLSKYSGLFNSYSCSHFLIFIFPQGRLGPGRIHHCMRTIGLAERTMDVWLERIMTREAFGKKLSQFDSMMQEIALSRIEIDQARLLTLKAAHSMDVLGNQLARDQIAAIKIVAPRMVCKVIDRAIQAFGMPSLHYVYHITSSFCPSSSASTRPFNPQ